MDMAADPLNDPFLKWENDKWVPFTTVERMATIAFVSWKYLQLLVFPFPLTHDYYPFVIEVRSFSSAMDWLGAIAMLGLLVGGLWSLRKRTPIGFSILFYLITISVALNIFFPIGTFMAERFLFTPSVGFCLGVVMLAMLWKHQLARNTYAVAVPAAVIIALFAVMTVVRNGDWKDNLTLHESALHTSERSVKLQNDYGTIKLSEALSKTDSVERKALIDTAFLHLEKAVKAHQTYYDAMLAFGAASYYKGEFEYAVFAYKRAFTLFPEDTKSGMGLYYALQGFAFDQAGKKNYDKAIEALQQAQAMAPDSTLAKRILEYESLRAK
jgi:hypothetical protein